ncbi:trehalose operon repressor [Halobacteroides halobius DSM 5150]|uniref:Trehalose operon repressor n=1 Tax=Halobacteroides halobius (strain ATCC 35273 / DSM 5150 / MD-1) TaxID=748449 RepID=L0K9V0_HALHC|nr:trehalose operon repressor [Halobacteroides halobius]AGB42092.1 trehalose operon repressor [Halobacteroides halobius DSM 5150]
MKNKYLKIYNEIVKQIENGELEPNVKLPSENNLADKYGASRGTIRKALNLLSQNGYIQKIKGKGSIVLDVKKFDFPISGIVTFKELSKKMGQASDTTVHQLDLMKPDNFLKNQLSVTEDDQIWKVVRAREIGQDKIILDKDFFNQEFVPSLTKEICEGSIYEYLEDELGLEISFAKKVISVEEATREDKEYLDLNGYNVVAVVKNYVHLNDASLFQYTESRHRPDKFRFIDFSRRGV